MAEQSTPLHGWLVVDKPKGVSSAHVVARVKRLTRAGKVGHAGTLDPLATGILPIALGEATKTTAYAMADRKRYRFELTFGESRTTDDAEGDISATSAVRPTLPGLEAVLPAFTGGILQMPPVFSALKVQGKRAYALAREGKDVTLAARPVEIYGLTLSSYDGQKAVFDVDCGKGTYIRSLARDIAQYVGTCGYVSELRRINVGKFTEEDAISLDKLEEMVHTAPQMVALKPLDWVLDDILGLSVTSEQACRIRQGQAVTVNTSGTDVIALAKADASPVALGMVTEGMFKPTRVFNI